MNNILGAKENLPLGDPLCVLIVCVLYNKKGEGFFEFFLCVLH